MKIVIATPLYPPEIETLANYVKELAVRLKAEHEITIVAYASTAEKIPGVKLITVSKHWPLLIRLFMYTFVLFRATKNADIVYAQNSATSGLASVIIQKIKKIPVVINFWEHEAWKRAMQLQITTEPLEKFVLAKNKNRRINAIMRLQRWTLKNAKNIVFSSSSLAQTVKKIYDIPDSNITINFIPPEKTLILSFKAERAPYQIFTNGRLFYWNDLFTVIRAVSEVKGFLPETKLLISGEGPETHNLKKLTQELNLSDNIVFLGRTSRAEDWQILRKSQIYIHNYDYLHENFPNTILTSFLAKTPVIASRIDGIEEIIQANVDGLLVKPQDVQDLSEKIIKILKDKNFQQEIISCADKVLEERFSWNSHLENLNTLFEKIYVKKRN